MHAPLLREHDSADTMVIFVHGFMGSPNQFADLAEAAYGHGCSVCSILLPGHGGSWRDFVRYGLSDWQQHLQNELDKHMERYQKIFVVGHSMGGLLAINASLPEGNRISGLCLISTPLRINYSPRAALLKLKLISLPQSNHIRAAYMAGKSAPITLHPNPYWQFNRLMAQTRRNLPRVLAPVLLIHSQYDETVAFASAALLHDGLVNTVRERITLKQSWHAWYPQEEREQIVTAVLNFIQ